MSNIVQVPIAAHKFRKTNSITIHKGGRYYDEYTCELCQLEGKRFGFNEYVECKESRPCNMPTSEKVKVTNDYPCQNFGFNRETIYDVVECPQEYLDRFANDVWIYSTERGEPVRLLPGEFEFV